MLYRLGVVLWWFGALSVGFGVVGSVVALFQGGHEWLLPVALGLLFAAFSATLAYILTGSFWRPPQRR